MQYRHFLISGIAFGGCSYQSPVMDSRWFKAKHREAEVTQAEAASMLGRTPTFLTRIYAGQQELRFSEAERLATILKAPLSEVLSHAGLGHIPTSKDIGQPTSLSEGDAVLWMPNPDKIGTTAIYSMAEMLGAGTAGREIWRVSSSAMILDGYAEGDFLLIDQQSQAAPGDVVLVQAYDMNIGSAVILLRRYEPPVLVAASINTADKPLIVGPNAKITGVVTASWRAK